MSIFKDFLKRQVELQEDVKTEAVNKVTIPEGISFTDANKSKVILSVVGDSLKITKVIRKNNYYTTEDILLKKDYIPFLGKILLNFYNDGNINKIKEKLEVDDENAFEWKRRSITC